jgi:hypothetical protein
MGPPGKIVEAAGTDRQRRQITVRCPIQWWLQWNQTEEQRGPCADRSLRSGRCDEAGTGATLSDYEPLLRAGRCGETGVRTALSDYGPLAARGAWQRTGIEGQRRPITVHSPTRCDCGRTGQKGSAVRYRSLPLQGSLRRGRNRGRRYPITRSSRARVVAAIPVMRAALPDHGPRPAHGSSQRDRDRGGSTFSENWPSFVTPDLFRGPPDRRRCGTRPNRRPSPHDRPRNRSGVTVAGGAIALNIGSS